MSSRGLELTRPWCLRVDRRPSAAHPPHHRGSSFGEPIEW